MSRWTLHHGDALATLRAMPTASIDAIVTDPPAGIGFMNAAWDKDKGGRDAWIAWLAEVFTEARRVAKPGAHALVWALPRTSHWTATGLEDAGWELRDRVAHFFGTGFPKSHSISLAMDKAAGAERPVVGPRPAKQTPKQGTAALGDFDGGDITSAASAASAAWDGWGTALKPAVEDWHLARAPFAGTVAANVAEHGTGALHIDACRINGAPRDPGFVDPTERADGWGMQRTGLVGADQPTGRWPAHLVLSHNTDCIPLGTARIKAAPAWNDNRPPSSFTSAATSAVHHADGDGTETVGSWQCSDGCAVAMLDAQGGERVTHGGNVTREMRSLGYQGGGSGHATEIPPSTGGASRFFFCAKPSTAERELGLDGFTSATVDDGRAVTNDTAYQRGATQRRNIHPTVKSVALMRWLMRLITPPDGLVLDLFAGSGTTGIAAMCEGVRFVGCEAEAPFHAIASARIAFAAANPRAFDPETPKPTKADPRQADLFGRTGT